MLCWIFLPRKNFCISCLIENGKVVFACLNDRKIYCFLDCIGSAFNAKGAMQCPNCRQVEGGQWLYSSGSLIQQEDFIRNDYARTQTDMAYLHNERHEERFDEVPRWSTRLYGHHVVSQEEEDSLINSYPYSTADERQHQGVPRYHTDGTYMPNNPGLDLRRAAPASEMAHRSAHLIEAERPLRPSRASSMYMQSLQPMMPRLYEQSSVSMLPEFYPSQMLERPGYRRRMDDDGYEEHSMYRWPVARRHSIHRGPSDMGVAFNPTHMHVLPDFGLQGGMSSLEQSNINRIEVARYGHFARRGGSYPSYVSNGLEDFVSRSFSNGYDGHSSHFNNRGANWMGRGIPQL